MVAKWLRIDEHRDVLSSTDMLALVAPTLQKNPHAWKWMILAAHNGVQGAIVCAIQDTSRTSVLSKESATAMLDWLATLEGERPREHLADFISLLKKYRKAYRCSLPADQHRKIIKLHREFRNSFVHFTPTYWSIEISMLPELIESAVDFIAGAMKQEQVVVKLSGNFKRQIERNLSKVREALAPWKENEI
jgi:hypothetical protein